MGLNVAVTMQWCRSCLAYLPINLESGTVGTPKKNFRVKRFKEIMGIIQSSRINGGESKKP
jgi:hypothetical protein